MSEYSPDADEREPYKPGIDHEHSDRMVSAIVSGVATRTGRGVTDLPPLYDVVDPEALEQVFASPPRSRRRSNDKRIVFTYAGCEIVIDGDDELMVRLLEDQQARE